VLGIDELLYTAVIPKSRKACVENVSFGMLPCDSLVDTLAKKGHFYLAYVHVWVLLLFSLATTLIVRRKCDPIFEWNNEAVFGSFTGFGV